MTTRKVLELAMDKAKEFWIFMENTAFDADYADSYLNKLESRAWDIYEDCCLLYKEELKKVREQRREKYDHW